MILKETKKLLIVFLAVFFASIVKVEGIHEPLILPGVVVVVSFAFAWGGGIWPAVFLGILSGDLINVFVFQNNPLMEFYGRGAFSLLFFPTIVTVSLLIMDKTRQLMKKESVNFMETKDLASFFFLTGIFTLTMTVFTSVIFYENGLIRALDFFLLAYANTLMVTPILYLLITRKFLLFLRSKTGSRKQMGYALVVLLLFGVFTVGPLGSFFNFSMDLDITLVLPMMFVAIFLGQTANAIQMALIWVLGIWGFGVPGADMGRNFLPPVDFSIFMISIGIIILWVTAISESLKKRTLYLEVQNEILTESEEKIRNSEKRLDVIFRSSPIIILLVNMDTAIITDCNEQTTKGLGYERDELIGMSAFQMGIWNSETEKDEYLELLNLNGRVEEHEVSIRQKKGEIRVFVGSTEAIDIDGQSFVIIALVDITENKENQRRIERFNEELENTVRQRTQDLYEAKEFTEKIIGNTPVGVFTLDDEGTYISANEIGAKMLDTTMEDLVGRNYKKGTRWKEHGLDKLAEWTMETGENTGLESNFITSKQRSIWLECNFSRFSSGNRYYLLLVTHDVTERRIAEKQLKDAKEFNDKVLKNSPVGIFTYNSEGQCISANEMAAKITGQTIDQLKTYNYKTGGQWEVFGLKELADRTMETGEDGIMEANLTALRGRTSWQEFRTARFSSGEEDFLLVMSSETTARKEMEQALKKAENSLRSMTNNLPLVVFQATFEDGIFEFTFVNKLCYEVFEIPENEEILGKTIFQKLMPEDQTAIREIFFSSAKKRASWRTDFRILDAEKLRWFHIEAIPVEGDNGETLWNGYMQETTDQRAAEEDANLFFKTSIDLMAIEDMDGRFKRLSPSWENVLGWEEEELQGRAMRDFVHAEDLPIVQEEQEKLENGGAVASFISRFRCRDGSYRWLSWNSHNQMERGIRLSIARDITEAKRVEQVLIEAKNAAEGADKAKSEFLANMSHEIRTPLNAVIGFSEILGGQATDQKQKVYLDAINTAGKSLLRLINDILDLSKIEAGMMGVHFGPVNTETIFKEIQQIFRMTVQEKNIDFIMEIDETIPKVLMLDEARLRQVLLNLVGNAVKFTDHGYVKLKVVKRSIDSEGKKIDLIIAVQDTGIGIKKEELNEVFHSFRQQYGQSNRKYGGTGLGLSISKRLVELMNGRIELESEQGLGSTFTIYLREIEVASFERVENPELLMERLRFNGEKVMVVDDVESNRELVREQLAMVGLKVYTAVNGEDAIYKVENLKPEVVLMDLMMPIMDGEEAARQIKDNDELNHIPIIALTASTRIRSYKEEEESPFSGYLSKPVSAKQLYQEIQRFIRPKESPAPEGIKEERPPEGTEVKAMERSSDRNMEEKEAEQLKELLGTSLTNLQKGLRRSAAVDFIRLLEQVAEKIENPWLVGQAARLKTAIGNTDIEGATGIINELYEEIYRI